MRRPAYAGPGALPFRYTIRTRLTLTFVALMVAFALAMIGAIYLFMRYGPTYDFTGGRNPSVTLPGLGPVPPAPPRVQAGTATPTGLVVKSTSDLLTTLLIVSGCALAVAGCLAVVLVWLATGRMLRPLNEISAAARRADSGRLDHRIALRGPQDELKDLSDTFDVMLARLEQAFLAHQRFAANASHELRTPLATTQAVLDVAIAEPESQDVLTLATKLRIMNRQSVDTVDALLDLADSAHGPVASQPVDLAPLVQRTPIRKKRPRS